MYSDIERALTIADMHVYERIPAKNVIHKASAKAPGYCAPIPCVWKPKSGERVFHPIVKSHFYLREVAAFQFSKMIDGVRVPATVEREWNGTVGALQRFLDDAVVGDYINMDYMLFMNLDQWRWAAAFDYVIGNMDRHAGNWMVDNKGRLWLIDHGSSFPDSNDCWRGSLSVMRPMINRKVEVTEEIKDALEENKERFEIILDTLNLVGSVRPMLERVDRLQSVSKFSELVIER